MTKMAFNVGDRVQYVGPAFQSLKLAEKGTVREVDRYEYECRIRWDNDDPQDTTNWYSFALLIKVE